MGHANLILTDQTKGYPTYLKAAAGKQTVEVGATAPILFRPSDKQDEKALEKLVAKHHNIEVIDNYAEQYAELLLSKNAHLYRANYEVQVASIQELLDEHYAGKTGWSMGSWVYLPWKNQLIHILEQDDFEALRTIRNKDLITVNEQKQLLDAKVAVFGMSVGSASALAMAISGISRQIKLIDGAVISGSNLNRILTGVSSVGKSKALVIGQQIYEMNPYSTVEYHNKVSDDNIASIFDDSWKLDLVIDEIDDIQMKMRIRYEARKRQIPVLMATELGDTVMIDVERYDLEPLRPLLHDKVANVEQLLEKPPENYREWTKHAVSIIDPNNMTIKMQKSLLKIGSTIVTHPQLGSTVMMTGGALAFAAKNIIIGGSIPSGRYVISLEKQLLSDHRTRHYRRAHKKHTKVMQKAVSSM